MKAVVTLRIKLDLTPDVDAKLTATRRAYVEALNRTSAVAFDGKIASGVTLHHATYKDIREATGLPANLVCSSRAVVAGAYTRDPNRKHRWRDHAAMRYDARTLRVDLARAFATLSTLDGRVRAALVLCDYHRRFLDGSWTFVKGATLKRSGKAWMLHLTAERDNPDSDKPGVLGVDAGIKRIATTSGGKVHKGGVDQPDPTPEVPPTTRTPEGRAQEPQPCAGSCNGWPGRSIAPWNGSSGTSPTTS